MNKEAFEKGGGKVKLAASAEFAERPDALTLLGGLIIIGSGLYTFARERARKRALSM